MSGDIVLKKEKKSKKTDSKQKSVATDEQPLEDALSEKEEKKKKKREKKEKKLAENTPTTAAEDNATVVDSEESVKKKKMKNVEAEESNATTEDNADSEIPRPAESEKKKKKKKRHAEEGEPMAVDAEAPASKSEEPEKKKKKKRKHEDQEGDVDGSTKSKAERKEKKRRRKDETSATSTTPPSNSAASSFAPSKAVSPVPNNSGTDFLSPPSVPSADEAAAFLTKHSITIHTPPGAPTVTPVIKFSQLAIPKGLQDSFAGFKEPTPIQACTWPPALEGRDVVGIAETGSGKTLAFGIPALCRLIKSPPLKPGKSTVSVLVVAPTRELAIQTHETLSALGKPFGIASVAVFGGVPKEPQVKMLKNANKSKDGLTTRIIVGTPGRILDLMQDGACDLSEVDYLVLDEADRMLDKGFENDIRNIISSTKASSKRQTMMFSATWPEAVRRLAGTFQRDPVRVTVGSDDLTANSRVEQSVEVFDDARSKDQRLLNLLQSLSHKKTSQSGASEARILVFALYKKEASRVEQMLRRQGYAVGALHGDMSQTARMETLENFKNGRTGLMVATDVAARGLDIPNVGAVINYTFPLTIEDYIHRIGRTGRGGRSGKAITFFTGDGHERALAGEFARVLREGGFGYEGLKRFPMTIKKREHSAYGAFFREDIPVPLGPRKIVF